MHVVPCARRATAPARRLPLRTTRPRAHPLSTTASVVCLDVLVRAERILLGIERGGAAVHRKSSLQARYRFLVDVAPLMPAARLRVALLAHSARSGDFVEKLLVAAPAVGSDTAAEDAYATRHRGVWQGLLTFHRHDSSVILSRGFRCGGPFRYAARARSVCERPPPRFGAVAFSVPGQKSVPGIASSGRSSTAVQTRHSWSNSVASWHRLISSAVNSSAMSAPSYSGQ